MLISENHNKFIFSMTICGTVFGSNGYVRSASNMVSKPAWTMVQDWWNNGT